MIKRICNIHDNHEGSQGRGRGETEKEGNVRVGAEKRGKRKGSREELVEIFIIRKYEMIGNPGPQAIRK